MEHDEGGESKQELQRRMDETRDSISETVAEIKTVVAQQYEEVRERVETVREGVSEVLDWREQFDRNPVVWGAGAVSVGILIGIGLSRAFDDDDEPARGGRRQPREPNAGQRLMGELTGLADAVLPTISAHVKDLFGLDLDAYLRQTKQQQLAEKKKKAARPRAAKKAAARKPAPAKGAARKRAARKRAAKES